MIRTASAILFLVLVASGATVHAGSAEKLDVLVRGHTLTVALYRPAGAPRGTIVMGSGDVGWVGLAVSLSDEFCRQGDFIVGINGRQYPAAFTSSAAHAQALDL